MTNLSCSAKYGHTAAGDLEQVLLLVVLEHAGLDLDEVVRDEQCQQRVVVRIDRDVQRDHAHVDQHRVDRCAVVSMEVVSIDRSDFPYLEAVQYGLAKFGNFVKNNFSLNVFYC